MSYSHPKLAAKVLQVIETKHAKEMAEFRRSIQRQELAERVIYWAVVLGGVGCYVYGFWVLINAPL